MSKRPRSEAGSSLTLLVLFAIAIHSSGVAANQALARLASDLVELPLPTVSPTGADDPARIALTRPERLTVIAPKFLRPQSDYHVLINLANIQAPVTIDLQITGARDSNVEQTEAKSILANSSETQTVKFSIADWPPAEYILSVNAQASDRSWNYTQEAPLVFQPKTFSGFIQTDKAIYKPGQLVQFRALFLSSTLAPVPMKNEINVSITDPGKNLIRQWTALSNYRGLLSLDMPLSEDPMLGDYSIRVSARKQEFSKQFSVAEYVLPTYDVQIQLPSYATFNESKIVASVKARYTYGKPVNGLVSLAVQPLAPFRFIETKPFELTQYKSRLVNGSADIEIDIRSLLKHLNELYGREIEFFALVEEDLTGRKYNRTERLQVYDKPIKVEHVDSAKQTFKPGLKHSIQLVVAYQDGSPVENDGPELVLYYGSPDEDAKTLKLRPFNGLIECELNTSRRVEITNIRGQRQIVSPTRLDMRAVYRGQEHYLNSILPLDTKSGHYLRIFLPQLMSQSGASSSADVRQRRQVQSGRRSVNINDNLHVVVQSTEPMQQVTCQGLARGDIVWATSPNGGNKTEIEFDIRIDHRMAPRSTILCFYIRQDNKELIADSTEFVVNGLMKNFVKIAPSRTEAKPGQEVEVNIFTKPNSLVGILGIDQSVLLLKKGNDLSQKDINEDLESYGTSGDPKSRQDFLYAANVGGLIESADLVILTNNLVYNNLEMYPSTSYASKISLAPDSIHPPIYPAAQLQSASVARNEAAIDVSNKPVIRSFFPETWLWQNATTGSNGQVDFKAAIPDTITSWQLSAFSLNEAHGLGLSMGTNSVRVFRPFFIKLNLPYSIIRGEIVSIQAVVFNYGSQPTSAQVSLENQNDEFDFVEAANSIDDEKMSSKLRETRQIEVPAEDGVSVSFLIQPKKLGHIDIKVVASAKLASDALVKKLLVKPEGKTQHFNRAMMVDLRPESNRFKRNVSIEVPANAVPGSQKVFVSAIGDILGAGLSNVDDLLRLPYGCGEQNMINLVPNIAILNYLQSSKRLRDSQRHKAKRNIETGYQRQLNYARTDGSFSAFGQSDTNGSVWLTAYVLKSFQQAKLVGVDIDEQVLRRAATYLAQNAKPDGTFQETGMLHNKALASSANGRPIYLTAYVLIALLQRPVELDPTTLASGAALLEGQLDLNQIVGRGLDYLESHIGKATTSPYELAIIAHALHLAGANRQEAMNRAYEQLWSHSSRRSEDRDAAEKETSGPAGETDYSDLVWWSSEGLAKEDKQPLPESAPDVLDAATRARLRSEELSSDNASVIAIDTFKPQPPAPPLKPLLVTDAKQSAHLHTPDALAIEATSFALLTITKRGELNRALPVVRWLISQQNSQGGFASTQDTVLAIESLANFAQSTNNATTQMINFDFQYERQAHNKSSSRLAASSPSPIRRYDVDQLQVAAANSLVQQQLRLPDAIDWVQIEASGAGAAVVQVSWQYNLMVSAEKPAFYLNPMIDRSSTSNYLLLNVCTYYTGPSEASNMAVAEVELPSGFVADAEALPGLRRRDHIKRVDTSDGETKVIVYLDRVDKNEICFTIPAHRSSKVSNNKPVPVSIYDYYDRKQAARIFYEPKPATSCDICEADSCSDTCSSKPAKASDKFVSLHAQRGVQIPTGSGHLSSSSARPKEQDTTLA